MPVDCDYHIQSKGTTMPIDCDYHIHSRHSPCGDPVVSWSDIVGAASRAGLRSLGLTDHLFGAINLPALEAAREAFDALATGLDTHFAVEVSALRDWDHEQNAAAGEQAHPYGVWAGGPEDSPLTIYLDEALKDRLGFEYVIGGAHWVLGAPFERDAVIRSYHRQNLFLAAHPLVDVVAHPWWWQGHWEDAAGRYHGPPWLDDFTAIPHDLHRAFAETCLAHGTAVEINAGAIFNNPRYTAAFKRQYVDYLRDLREWGVTFSIGSDAHVKADVGRSRDLAPVLDAVGLGLADLWRPPER